MANEDNKILEVRTFTHSPQTRLSVDIGLQLTEYLQEHPEYRISQIDSYVVDDVAYTTIVFIE